jgi:predicted GIY-YIG superfamily endonuclease
MNIKKHYWLYVLQLNEGKYYIGRTSRNNPQERIDEHKGGFYSAQWVKKYGFIELVEVINAGNLSIEEAEKSELELTLSYMQKYGLNNVRGGKLNYSGKYYRVFSRFFRKDEFRTLIGVSFMTAVLLALLFLDK